MLLKHYCARVHSKGGAMRLTIVLFITILLGGFVFMKASPKGSVPQQLMAAIAININPEKIVSILQQCSRQQRKELINNKARFVTTVGFNEPIVGVLSPKKVLEIELKVAPYYISWHQQKLYQIKWIFDFVEQS